MGSSKDLLGEARKGVVVDDKVFVAVSKELKESKSTLQWALQNSNGKKKICIIYVHVPAKMIPMPMGGKFPASQVGEKELKAFREQENREMHKILDDYLQICAKVGAHAEKLHIERDSIEEGIVEIISRQKIGRLVMGAAADSRYSRKMVEPKSKKANYVRQHAPDFCHIRFICKGRLICTREGVKQPSLDVEERSSKSLENVQIDLGILSQKLHSSLRISNDDGSEGSSDRFIQTLRPCFSESSIRLPGPKSAFSSPCSSFSREGAPDSSLELLVLPQTKIEHQRSSPPSVLQESSMNDDLYDQLVQAMEEADNSKREAFEESMRRRKAEKEAINAIRKAKSAESLYFEEFRQRKEQEEELAKWKQELEFMKSQLEKDLKELQEASDRRLSLENQYEKSKITEKEMEEKMFSAVGLLQKYKTERDELQVERDHALREAEILRKQLDQKPSSSHVPFFFSEFSFSDLEKATNNFDPSLKIGEGGYGSIYKGFLRQTQVAIKILNPNSMQGPQEFEQEVDVLSKLRHPNLVTLIGACHESWALVYEYLSGGSLEDRLICKDNTPPLPWQTRIQIATDLCVILIFLHSSRPTSIIHVDIKPSNILLDENFVCKLSDFGICCVISHTETSMEQTTRFCTSQPKGTFSYMDPEFLTTGELTPKCDIYSFGIILLRLLTGRPAMGITKEVEYALSKGNLNCLLDPSAGDWPFVQAEQLARMALRCCEMNGRNRPDLESDVWRVLEPMKASSRSLSMPWLASDDRAPHYFICPIFQEIMEDPQIASDGFTYEAEAIRGWLDSGHDTSPMTNAKLAKHDFIPNHALRSAIQEWIQSRREDFPASVMAIREVEDKLYKELERQEVENMLDKYVQIIKSFQVPSEKIYIEKESVADGILELISQLGIQKLVMGAGPNSRFVGSLTKPASQKSNYVLQHAPDFCHIFFVSEARLIYTREGVKQLNQHLKGKELNRLSYTSVDSPSAHSSSESSPPSQNTQHVSSPTNVLPNIINNYPCDQLRQALAEVELARHKAHEEYKRRQQAEEEAVKALHKLKAAEDELAMQFKIIKVLKMFSQAADIKAATMFFDPSLRIQEGDYESVYKGFLHNTEVAIKIIKPDSLQGIANYKLEIDVLSKLRHPNLLTLIGASPDPLALIYEYLPNGSLEDRLICKDSTHSLSWQTRIRIVTELCSVLNFLHSIQPCSIIHGDLNPKNVLLDANFSCKLSGLGSCHIIANNKKTPTEEHLSPKYDVYSFGIILLRLLTGKPALNIVKKVQRALQEDNFYRILDPSAGDWPVVRAVHLVQIALKCCDVKAKDRPDLGSEVWKVLKPVMNPTSSLSSPLQLVSGDQVPSYFICPIFQEIMRDPQVAADGFTYEADAIRGWFEGGHDTSPMTNLKLDSLNLTPNRTLRSAIQEWQQTHQLE
uniref:RING-type E3 ubiquitin transferase n=1 Tax=Chenopodium quinoa TaxID=63459 RepID=A0A803KZA3_CHEQI